MSRVERDTGLDFSHSDILTIASVFDDGEEGEGTVPSSLLDTLCSPRGLQASSDPKGFPINGMGVLCCDRPTSKG